MTRHFTLLMCVYDLLLHSNMRPVRRAATVIASFRAPCVNFIVSLESTYRSRIVTDKNILPAYQFSMIIERAYSQARKLTYSLNEADVMRCLRLKRRHNLHNAAVT